MITLLENSAPVLGENLGFVETKILSNFLAYKTAYPFLTFWQGKKHEKITSVICKFEDTVFLSVLDDSDYNELKDFLEVIGFSSIQAEVSVLERLGFSGYGKYVCLKLQNACDGNKKPHAVNLKRLYDIIFEAQDKNLTPPEFDGWYADLSHRIRHSTAVAVMEETSGGAIASHITPYSAVISGVRVLKESRGQGKGTLLIKKLLNLLPGKTVYTATDCKTAKFYIKCGFTPIGEIGVFTKC